MNFKWCLNFTLVSNPERCQQLETAGRQRAPSKYGTAAITSAVLEVCRFSY